MSDWLRSIWNRLFHKRRDGSFPKCYGSRWRPAKRYFRLANGRGRWEPVKVCSACGYEVELDHQSFYAQFGRMPW
jgi:hypothetical protein